MAVALVSLTFGTRAADIQWQGGAADYTTAADWVGGVVPGFMDNAINDNGSNNMVQITGADPAWTVNQLRAGNGGGNGAFVQNGQTVTASNINSSAYMTSVRLGLAAGDVGVYTMNGGTLNYSGGGLYVGELGTGILNVAGGLITGTGNLAVNYGMYGTPTAVNATMDTGTNLGGYTWFAQGFYTPDTGRGLPPAGATFASVSQSDHSYTMAASYAANNTVMVNSNLTSATITLTPQTTASKLSFLASSGNGAMNLNYTIHHADNTAETGTLAIPDWFGSATVAYRAGGRVLADGTGIEILGTSTNDFPYLFSLDVSLTDTTSPVTSIGLSYASGAGGNACVFAVSASTGAGFTPVSISGYNADTILGAGEIQYTAGTVTSVLNQTSGNINITGGGQFFVGNYGNGTYNLGGGTNDVHNYIALGRSGGSGTMTMTGGVFNQDGGGNLLVGTGYQAPPGTTAAGILNQSAGTVNCQGQFLCPENSPSTGTYNLSGTGSLIVNDWLVFGRGGAAGVLNMTGGSILQTNSGGNFEVGEGTTGTVNQSGGSVTTYDELWVGQSGGSVGVYNLSGSGTVTANSWLAIGRQSGNGTFNLTNGVLAKIGNSGNHITVGSGGPGVINQYGGLITNTTSDFFLGESAAGTWNFNGGTADLANVIMCVNSSASGQLNLNGGLFQASSIVSPTAGSTVSLLNLNGATLQANADSTTFISGLYQAAIGSGGVVIDSQAHNLTIPQALMDNGGGTLTKIGTGTVTLTGANSYSGATVINAGKLIISTASATSGGYTVADNAGFGIIVQSAGAQFNASSLSVGVSTGGSIDFNLGGFGNPTSAPLTVGNYTANGTVTINVSASVIAAGTIPLIQYSSLTGSPSYTLGTLPAGVVAHLATSGNVVDLVVTSAGAPRWDGNAGGTWDLGSDQNWYDLGTLALTTYHDGEPVIFDDNASGTTTVDLTTTVHPASVNFNNNSLPYTLVGPGAIAGSIGMNLNGGASVSVLNTGGNSFTGPVTVNAGILNVTNLANGGSPSPLGASSASPTNLVVNQATFEYSGAPLTVNRGLTLGATNTTIDAEGSITIGKVAASVNALGGGSALTKVGPGQFGVAGTGDNEFAVSFNPGIRVIAGTLLLDGSAGAQTNHTPYDLWVGSTPASGASLIVSNTILNVDTWLAVGRGNGTVNNVSTMTVYNSTLSFGNVSLGYDNGISGNSASQYLSLYGNSSMIDHGDMNLGESGGSTATIYIGGTSVLSSQNRCFLGGAGNNAHGAMTVANSGQFVVVNGWFSFGNNSGSTGSLVVQDNGLVAVHGDFNVTDVGTGTANMVVTNNGDVEGYGGFYVGKSTGAVGTVNQYGGIVHANNNGNQEFQIGCNGNGTYNLFGGSVISDTKWFAVGRQNGSTGHFTVSGGTVTVNNNALLVGEAGNGTLTVTNTGSVTSTSDFIVGNSDGNGTGTVNLGGGILSVPIVHTFSSQPSTFNFNGGILQARANQTTFMGGLTSANVLGGGATIDSAGYTIGIAQPLLNGGGNGGLTKIGNGTLQLNGVNTYTGTTLVSTGILAGVGTVAGPVNVAAGATLSAGSASIGTLTINNNLTLAAGSTSLMRIGVSSNDRIGGLTGVSYNGALVVTNTTGSPLPAGNTYTLFSSATGGSGNFSSVTILPSGGGTFNPATGVLTITAGGGFTFSAAKVSGSNLILTGSGGSAGAGYSLLTTTNLALPLSAWTTNSAGTLDANGAYSNTIPIIPGQPAAFFKLRQP